MTQIPKKCKQRKSAMSANVFLFSFFLAFTGNISWYISCYFFVAQIQQVVGRMYLT